MNNKIMRYFVIITSLFSLFTFFYLQNQVYGNNIGLKEKLIKSYPYINKEVKNNESFLDNLKIVLGKNNGNIESNVKILDKIEDILNVIEKNKRKAFRIEQEKLMKKIKEEKKKTEELNSEFIETKHGDIIRNLDKFVDKEEVIRDALIFIRSEEVEKEDINKEYFKAFHDYSQWSIGFGTKAKRWNETITNEEAVQRFKEAIEARYDEKLAKFPKGIQIAAISYKYNTGKFPGGNSLRELEHRYNAGKIHWYNAMFYQVYAGGYVHNGLVKRRKKEKSMNFLIPLEQNVAYIDNK